MAAFQDALRRELVLADLLGKGHLRNAGHDQGLWQQLLAAMHVTTQASEDFREGVQHSAFWAET